jgi:TonB family protein
MVSTGLLLTLLLGGNPASSHGTAGEVPTPTWKVAPPYADSIRRAGVQGTVIVQALVGSDGRVQRTRVLQSVQGLDPAAETAMRRWRFNPPRAKAAWITVPFCFGPGEWTEEDEPKSGRETVYAVVVRPDLSLSLEQRIAFYVARLADSTYIEYSWLAEPHAWMVAPEELGFIGALALPPLIQALEQSENVSERTRIFYALMLASQGPGTNDAAAQAELRTIYTKIPDAFPEESQHAALKEAWLRWWANHRDALSGH